MGVSLVAAHSHRRAACAVPTSLCRYAALAAPLQRVTPQLSRYALVSMLALAVDFRVFLALVGAVLRPSLAGAAGYATGLALHYALSVRFVFDAGATGKSETRLVTEYFAAGFIGLAITVIVIDFAFGSLGLPPLPAKIAAASASFLIVFALRRMVVFAARAGIGVQPGPAAAKA
jgi:putative flippase GtrA